MQILAVFYCIISLSMHIIQGPAFSSWLSDASMVSGDGLKVWKVGYQVLLCRVAANDVHHMLHSSNGRPVEVRQRRSTSLPIYNTLSTKRAITNEDEGKKNSHGQTPTAHTLHNDVELQALHTLAAAANYAGLHGTPAIHSVLSHAADMKALQAQGIEEHLVGSLKDRLRAAGLPPPPSPLFKKARNDTEIEPSQQVNDVKLGSGGGSSETVPNPNFAQTFPQAQLMFPQRVQPSIVAVPGNLMTVPHPHFHFALQQQTMMNQFKGLHQHHHHHQHQQPQLQPPQQQPGAGASTTDNGSLRIAHSSSPKEWQPSQGATAFAAILSVLGKHNWSAEEMGLILKFRAKYVVLDAVGREVAFLSIMQFQNDKNALVEMLKGLLESNHAVDVATSEHIANLPPTKIE